LDAVVTYEEERRHFEHDYELMNPVTRGRAIKELLEIFDNDGATHDMHVEDDDHLRVKQMLKVLM
jgi:hypothetical protein